MNIISHRGNLDGRTAAHENCSSYLAKAVASGFSVEFDVNLALGKDRLVLSHDEAAWSGERDPSGFLSSPSAGSLHALNIKDLCTVYEIARLLEQAGTKDQFFLFDFELLTNDLPGVRYLMRSLRDQGFRVAHRLSEREQHLDHILSDDSIDVVWLDEFEHSWIERSHVQRLADRGKRTFCVSPELHGRNQEQEILSRWSDLIQFGVDGICTDYPLKLRAFSRR
jgi:glycerophosphoryl diester phosphodiesterase